MSELYVLTLCHYRVPAGTVCYGSINIRKEQCQQCLIFHEKRPNVFTIQNPTLNAKKQVIVKVHAFGVTLIPRQVSKTTVKTKIA